jgi:L-rhamnose mutarotase
MKRYCLTLDLKDDPGLIGEYEEYHQNVWPEIEQSIVDSGIQKMEIYRHGSRLFMIMEVSDEFSFEKKAVMDQANPVVQKWETLMLKYQQPFPDSKPGDKWQLMEKIYSLKKPGV